MARTEENIRAEPNGTILGRVHQGTRLRVDRQQGSWTRVVLEGFVWTRSLQVQASDGFDLVISAGEGENLREEPSGRIAARFEAGTRFQEVERVPGWIRVRRAAWVWTPSLEVEDRAARPTEDGSGGEPREPPEPSGRDRWVRAPDGTPAILSAPDGDTLGRARSGSDLRVLGREGNWARVQLEGWVWLPEGEAPDGDDSVIQGVHPAELSADPDRYRGRIVELELQFISVERAERVRTDFHEGEPYLLTRSADGERTFVYVAVTSRELEDMERFTPLQRLRVVGRVRAGAAELTGNPVLDMLEVERVRR